MKAIFEGLFGKMMAPKLGKIIGSGTERVCYENPANPNTCLKVSKKDHSIQTVREIKYFKFLQKKKIQASFLPKFYGSYVDDKYVIIEQEYLRPDSETETVLLRAYIRGASQEDFIQLEQKLQEVKNEIMRLNVIISDIRTGNILLFVNRNKVVTRIVFLDGFGSPEFIPLPMYCPYFGKLKIERQWKKFMKRYNEEKSTRLNLISRGA